MDRRIFDQLDKLERGARIETRPQRDVYNNSSADFSAYDGPEQYHGHAPMYEPGYQQEQDEFVDQPMVLDSFDERLLRQPDQNSRQGQAALGRARLSLAPNSRNAADFDVHDASVMTITHHEPVAAQRFDVSRFASDGGQQGPSSSSPFDRPLPSSPAFKASQRRPEPVDYGRHTQPLSRECQPEELMHTSQYHPVGVEDLEAEQQAMGMLEPESFEHFQPTFTAARSKLPANSIKNDPPIVQGISLVTTRSLPDRFRPIFPYPLFNAVQSKTFDTIYKTNNNFVLSAPTGSGKTAVLELAICRLINNFASSTYKIVYQAPTKSLCAERQRDWQAKFGPLDLQCAELTGDTDNAQLRNVQHASIIITTPEKWDSMTRKWKDHQKLMQMVKLFLIDEVHILKEDRGATLEAVVSRMKSIGSDVRFVALSATVPNSEDIAAWLGSDPMNTHLPAARERFGEEFRPVRLQKHVCGYQANSNDFAFEKTLNSKLPDLISKWSQRKPIMVFCFTRNACVETAKLLANWWATKGPKERYWTSPRQRVVVADKDLKATISSGVAFHHAGLSIQDRNAIEKGYLGGEINVICCTSTLAVGVNLPCHMVIIKNTVTYQNNAAGGCKEYSDLEIMQMLGRAGRPQFDDSAVAVIMTRLQRVPYYEKMITGQELLESCLHRNLIDHLNAEIGLGTVSSVSSAKKWLSGTFLYVRLKENPEHYKIEGDAPRRSLDERLENICAKGIALLQDNDLVSTSNKLQCTEFGDAMARYYLQFDTMKAFLALPPKSKVSEILSAISQAAEFKDIRFRAGEKNTYKDLNKSGSIKFPIPVNLDAPAHKVSLVIQSVLGAVDLPTEDHKQRIEYQTAKSLVFQHAHRLVRCIIDCQLYLEDAVTTRNALMLARSLGAQVWDDSPLHMKQLDGVGLVAVRKLVGAGINSIEELENAEAHQLERAVSRNPPYGIQLQDKAKAFPKLRVSIKMMGEPKIKKGEHVTVNLKAEIGFLNEKVPQVFQRRAVYACLLAETSDGHKVHFARISAKKLNNGQDVLFSANLTGPSQTIRAYVMCDEIAGTMRLAHLKPEISSIAFPPPKTADEMKEQKRSAVHAPNTSKRRAAADETRMLQDDESDEFGDENLNDADLVLAGVDAFLNIDDFDEGGNTKSQPKRKKQKTSATTPTGSNWEPQQLANGKWACNHPCIDKTKCKHLCCREGLDKKPKPPKVKQNKKQEELGSDPKQTQLNMSVSKGQASGTANTSSKKKEKEPAAPPRKPNTTREAQDLDRLHNSMKTKTPNVPTVGYNRTTNDPGGSTAKGAKPRLSFLEAARDFEEEASSDYGLDGWDPQDASAMSGGLGAQPAWRMSPPQDGSGIDTMDDEMLDFGDDDSQLAEGNGDGHVDLSSYADDFTGTQDIGWQIDNFEEENFGTQVDMLVDKLHSKGTQQNANQLLVRHSTCSAIDDQGLRHSGNTDFHEQPYVEDAQQPGPGSSKFFPPPAKQHETASRTPSMQLREEAAALDQVPLHDEFLASVAETAEAEVPPATKENRPDELEKWFKAEFGSEHFNFV